MKTPFLIVTVMGTALLIAAARPQDDAGQPRTEQQEESARKIKELQIKKVAALKGMLEVVIAQRQSAVATNQDVNEVRLVVLAAEAEAAENEADRLKFYETIVEVAKEQDVLAEALFKSARAPYKTAVHAKILRYEAEINLEQAKARATK